MNRRRFLEIAASGLGATALCGPARAASLGVPRNLVVVYCYGGWDVVVGLDPKPGIPDIATPAGEVGSVGDIDFFVTPESPAVATYFERHAGSSALLRGIDMRSLSHFTCVRYALAGTADVNAPDMAAIVGHELGPERALPYLVLGDRALTGPLAGSAGRLGLTNQIGTLVDRSAAYPPLDTAPEADPFEAALVRSWVEGRVERDRSRYAGEQAKRRHDEFLEAMDRADQIFRHADAFQGGGSEPGLDGQIDMALYAIRNRMSRSVLLDSRMNWDSHTDLLQQRGLHEKLFTSLDRLMTSLAETPGEVAGRTLLDETLVVTLSEMARTPGLNELDGKDHWPYTAMLVAGGPVRGGRVYGATTDRLEGLPVDLASGELDAGGEVVAPAQMLAGILRAVGVDPGRWFPGVTPYLGPFEV